VSYLYDFIREFVFLAEREGFEPSVPFLAHTLSRRADSKIICAITNSYIYIYVIRVQKGNIYTAKTRCFSNSIKKNRNQ
jgi:hypothetical protein